MALFAERGEKHPDFEVRDEEIKLPKDLENQGIKAVETAFKANVKGDDGSVIAQPTGIASSFSPPADPQTLMTWAKGPITSALTWLAAFWLRMFKKQ